MQRLIFIILFIIPAGVFSFNQSKWKQTASGIYYRVYTDDTAKPKPVYGDHIWMHLRKYSPKQKEIFNTRVFDINNGVEMDYKKPVKEVDVTEIFSFMGKGDSAMVKIPSSVFDSNGSQHKYYIFWLNLIDFKSKDVYEAEKKEHYLKQIITDSLSINEYILNNNLQDIAKDEYGNRYIRTVFGSGNPVKDGETVSIHYIGKLTSGKEFDNSYERNQTLSFDVGKKQVIEGLDKAIQYFYTGDKGIILIPSRLGYGDKEVGKIPPNSVLIFEIEITE